MQQRQMLRLLAIGVSIGSLVFVGCKQQRRFGTDPQAEFNPGVRVLQRQLDLPYIPTPQPVVEQMLEIAKVDRHDVVYNLGSSNERLVITAFNIRKNLVLETEDKSDEGSKSYLHDEKISRTCSRFDDSPSHRCLRTTANSTNTSDRD